MTTLKVQDVHVRFGGVHALRDCTLHVEAGECVGLVGPNGAGKSTLMNAVSGLARVSSGRVLLSGDDVTRMPAWRRHRSGVARTFQLARSVGDLKVLDYVRSGHFDFRVRTHAAGVLRTPRWLAHDAEVTRRARELLDELELGEHADLHQSAIPLGARRLVDLARALLPAPRLLMIDEVVAGLEEHEARRIAAVIRRRRDTGMAVLLIEHDIGFVREISDRLVALADGSVLGMGRPDDVLSRPDFVQAFVGPGMAGQADERGGKPHGGPDAG